MNSPVEQIKERLTIEEVVSSYIKLEKAGINFKAKCPFHNEKTPSFFISPDRNSYYCFGCGAKGDIFSFIQEFEGLDFKGALKLLAEKAGVQLVQFNPQKSNEKDRLYKVMEKATLFFQNNLSKNTKAIDYLDKRGIEKKTIEDFRLGFALEGWSTLGAYLKSEGVSEKIAEEAGLIKKGTKGYYDRFRSRIMFPISDSSGRVIAFSGRIFGDAEQDEKNAKYLNSPETPLFNKSFVLYGLDKAKGAIRKNNFSILVEGQMDLVLSHQVGFKNTIATSGTALSEALTSKEATMSNLALVRRLSSNIVLAFDADSAGIKAMQKAGRIALYLGMDVKVAQIPQGQDPADLILNSGAGAWKKSIRESVHLIDFLLSKIIKEAQNDSRKTGLLVKERILPFVALIDSSIEINHFIANISQKTGIAETALMEDLLKVSDIDKKEREELANIEEENKILSRVDYIQRRIFGILFWQRSLSNPVFSPKDLEEKLIDILGAEFKNIKNNSQEEKEDYIFEAEAFYSKKENLIDEIDELLANLEEEKLKAKLSNKMRDLRETESSGDTKRSAEILKECQIINKRIEEIKNNR